MWWDSLERFIQDPLLGVGPGLLAREPGVAGRFAHPHNSVLLIAAETGLVGLVSVGLLTFHAVRRIRMLPFDRRPWAVALIGGGFHSLLSGTTIMPASQSLLVLSLAMVLPWSAEALSSDKAHSTQRVRSRAGLALILTGGMALAVLLATLFMPPADIFANIAPRLFKRGLIP